MRRIVFALMAFVLVASTSLDWIAVELSAGPAPDHAGMTNATMMPSAHPAPDFASVAMAADSMAGAIAASRSCCDRDAAKLRHGGHCTVDCGAPLPDPGIAVLPDATQAVRIDVTAASPTLPDTLFRPPIG